MNRRAGRTATQKALLTLALFGPLVTASGQDLVAIAPQLAKVEYEDARVRVVRLRIPEHATLPMHDRPGRVVVSLTPNHVLLTRSNGTTSETRTDAGTMAWSEPAVRSVLNIGGPVENIVIELKQTNGPAKAAAAPPTVLPATYLDDPSHRWVLENQYVRVYDVRVPAGVATALHRHAYDQVSVYVSGGTVSVQAEGQPWGPPATMPLGGVAFAPDANNPVTHRLRNDGSGEYHVVLVQFLE